MLKAILRNGIKISSTLLKCLPKGIKMSQLMFKQFNWVHFNHWRHSSEFNTRCIESKQSTYVSVQWTARLYNWSICLLSIYACIFVQKKQIGWNVEIVQSSPHKWLHAIIAAVYVCLCVWVCHNKSNTQWKTETAVARKFQEQELGTCSLWILKRHLEKKRKTDTF